MQYLAGNVYTVTFFFSKSGLVLVIPAATAQLLSKSFASMTLISIGLGMITTFPGLVLSYQVDMPSGAMMTLVRAAYFLVAMLVP